MQAIQFTGPSKWSMATMLHRCTAVQRVHICHYQQGHTYTLYTCTHSALTWLIITSISDTTSVNHKTRELLPSVDLSLKTAALKKERGTMHQLLPGNVVMTILTNGITAELSRSPQRTEHPSANAAVSYDSMAVNVFPNGKQLHTQWLLHWLLMRLIRWGNGHVIMCG